MEATVTFGVPAAAADQDFSPEPEASAFGAPEAAADGDAGEQLVADSGEGQPDQEAT